MTDSPSFQAIEAALQSLIKDCPTMAASDVQNSLRSILLQVRDMGNSVPPTVVVPRDLIAPPQDTLEWQTLPIQLELWRQAETGSWQPWTPTPTQSVPFHADDEVILWRSYQGNGWLYNVNDGGYAPTVLAALQLYLATLAP